MATWLTRKYVNGNTVAMCSERKQITTRPYMPLFFFLFFFWELQRDHREKKVQVQAGVQKVD